MSWWMKSQLLFVSTSVARYCRVWPHIDLKALILEIKSE
jgi:hypothetical protein